MPSIYSSQATVSVNAVGPTGNNGYQPIPLLDPLVITDEFLQYGGTAALTLFLGYVSSNGVTGFRFFVSIIDSAANQWVTEAYLGGTNGVESAITVSAVYDIPPQTNPTFIAQWQLEGTAGVSIQPPSTISFSAIIFEAMD